MEKPRHPPWRIQINNYLAGLCGGLISATAGYPLDVARGLGHFLFRRISAQVRALFSSLLDLSRLYSLTPAAILVRLLFGTSPTSNIGNGFAFTFAYNILKSGLVWPVQKNAQDYVKSQHFEGIEATLLSGAIGNVIPGIILNPFNVIKVRFMESEHNKTTMGIVKGILQGEGKRAFLRGIEATIIRDLLWGMVYFPTFEILKKRWEGTEPNHSGSLTLRLLLFQGSTSASAAAFATLMTSVIDGVRLFQMKSVTQGRHFTFSQGLRLALIPSQRNFLATITGVGRVTVTTVIGHVTFLQASRALDEL